MAVHLAKEIPVLMVSKRMGEILKRGTVYGQVHTWKKCFRSGSHHKSAGNPQHHPLAIHADFAADFWYYNPLCILPEQIQVKIHCKFDPCKFIHSLYNFSNYRSHGHTVSGEIPITYNGPVRIPQAYKS